MSPRSRQPPEPWLIHFFQRDARDDKAETVPAIGFLDQVPTKVRAEMQAVLEAVAEAPPPAFSGGGKWEVMRPYAFEWGARVRMRGGLGRDGQVTPPAWRSTRSL